MGRSFTAGNGGGSFDAKMWRRAPSGELVLMDVDPTKYGNPPKGARGRFELHGWSPYYETQSTYDGVTRAVTRTRAEYRIIKLAGHEQFNGLLFSQQFPIPRHIDSDKSNLGNFLRALLGRKFDAGENIDIDLFVGTEFVTSVTRDEVGDRIYCGISWEAIDPSKTVLSRYLAQPSLVAAGGSSDDDDVPDPFPTVDDDL